MNNEAQFSIVLYGENRLIDDICEQWETDLTHSEITRAAFPPTHSFVEFCPDFEATNNEQLGLIIRSLSAANISLDGVDKAVSIILPSDEGGVTITNRTIRELSVLDVDMIINS